jgi:phage tail sheath protein FI
MSTYQTPGVYIQEISTLPPSVAQVATAIPAFIGYTARSQASETVAEVAEISSLLEYELRFGKAAPTSFSVDSNDNVTPTGPLQPAWLMYYAISLYFKNGGGRCYIVSIGAQTGTASVEAFERGLRALEREDEPTLIVAPDAVLLEQDKFDSLNTQMLALCNKLQDRFAIFDVRDGDVDKFRNGIGTNHLAYGAAYHPYLVTSLTHAFDETAVKLGTGDDAPTLASIASSDTARYNRLKKKLGEQRVILPPSAAMAGIYAAVDRDRGVWKAPANVSVSSVIGPVEQITHEEQEQLNVDATSGKSINAIRAFAGKGTLVWGARTLAGNDNEWRYVPVRRLFITIEESAKKASAFAVFEPNDATTWLKVKGMLESYLYGLWEQGALQGSTPEAAYYVNVGLGKTMSTQDVLEGRMIVELGIAAVRPAEFIVLRFSHKLPEA